MANYVPKIVMDEPGSSNVNLSRVIRTSMAPGLLYPLLTEKVFPGDNVNISVSSLVKTMPTFNALFGSAKLQVDGYFIPTRLYSRLLHDDRTSFEPSSVLYPRFQLRYDKDITPSSDIVPGVHPSSLWHYLGVPQTFVDPDSVSTSVVPRNFNSIPFIGYWDIFRSYYANTQEQVFWYMGVGNTGGAARQYATLTEIDTLRQDILQYPATSSMLISTNTASGWRSLNNAHYALGGLACRTYLPDRFNVFINSDRYNNTLASALVDTSAGSFDMDALRFANKLNKMLQRTLISGGRYSDWQEVQYGARLRTVNEVPQFFGSISSEITFEDVVQTSSDTTGSDPLGTLGSRGRGYMDGRSLKTYIPEHGYVMIIVSIIPRVDYYQGVAHYLKTFSLSEEHVPALDSIGFQDLLVDDYAAASTQVNSSGDVISWTAIGKQPAWTELMTSINSLHGDFADPNKLMTMTFARTYAGASIGITYMDPRLFNQNFADSSITGQNFWLQSAFKFFVRRRISKKVMPSL